MTWSNSVIPDEVIKRVIRGFSNLVAIVKTEIGNEMRIVHYDSHEEKWFRVNDDGGWTYYEPLAWIEIPFPKNLSIMPF